MENDIHPCKISTTKRALAQKKDDALLYTWWLTKSRPKRLVASALDLDSEVGWVSCLKRKRILYHESLLGSERIETPRLDS